MPQIKGFQDTIDWYNANAEEYAKRIESRIKPEWIDPFTKLLPKGAKVLDTGCAGGRDCAELKHWGFEPIGVDLSHELIKYARKHHPDIKFHEGSFLELPFPDNTFDGVWSRASLLHFEKIEEVQQALIEFYRVLKPGGVVCAIVKQQLGEEKTSVVADSLSGHDRFFRWFTKDELITLLTKAGFTIIKIQDNLVSDRPELLWIHALGKKG